MPVIDLRDTKDPTKLQPLAHFVVLSAMLEPNKKVVRERIMDSVRRETGKKKIRRGVLSETKGKIIQQFGSSRGGEAGFMLGALIQLNSQRSAPSLSNAIDILISELPPIPRGWKQNWEPELNHEHLPRSPRILRKIFQDFCSVAHLWSAFLDGVQWENWARKHQREGSYDTLPISLEVLPNFLGTANAIWQLYDQISILKRGNGVTHIKDPWHFIIPHSLRIERSLQAMPIPDDRLNSITRPNQLSL